jgi:hypothetical protein
MQRRIPTPAFDLSAWMRNICADMAARLPQLAHVDPSRIAFACSRARKRGSHGLLASLTPLRFEAGQLYTTRGRHRWTIQRVYDPSGREMLYILRIYLPRFFEQDFNAKLVTLVHELWHIGPAFDGDLRRFPGRCYAHSHSEREYDELCRALASRWLALDPPGELVEVLHHRLDSLRSTYGRVTGQRVAVPKLIRLNSAVA